MRCSSIYACFVLFAITGFASSCVWADSKPQHTEVVQTFEPARNNGTPLVQVRFSNTVIGTFAIDTGEFETVITDAFAKKLDLKPEKYEKVWLGYGLLPITTVQIPEIKLENLTITGTEFRVVHQDFLPLFSDLPTVEEMLHDGFAPDAQEDLAKKASHLQTPVADTAKDVERLEKLGALLHEGQDEAGAKAAFAQAVTLLGKLQAESSDAVSTTDTSEMAAESSWRQALMLEPSQSDALTSLALLLRQNDKWTELRDLLTQQVKIHDAVPVRLTLACILSGEGLPADAEAQVRAAKALSPDNAAVNLTLADLLLARSSGDPAALSEASACLALARLGCGTLATPEQKATLITSEAVRLALDHDPDTAEKQLVALAREQPNCTQVREALAALIPY